MNDLNKTQLIKSDYQHKYFWKIEIWIGTKIAIEDMSCRYHF